MWSQETPKSFSQLGNIAGDLKGAHATVYWVQESSSFGNDPWYLLLVKMGLDGTAGTRSLRSGGLSSVLKLRAELESMQIQILAQGVGLHWRRPLGH